MSEIRVAFWNVENLFDVTASDIAADLEFTPAEGWTQDVFDAKVANLASIIKGLHGGAGPDLLGMCEIENRGVVETLLAAVGRPELKIAHVESPDIRGIDCTLVYSTNVFDDPPELVVGHLVYFRYPTRDIFQVKLRLRNGGPALNVFVNHWPSRRLGQYESEPHRITVAERCGRLVDDVLKFDRAAYAAIPDSAAGLAQINARWNENVLLMGDFNDEPFDRSITDYLLASKDLDKVEEQWRAGGGHQIPPLKTYLGRSAVLFDLSWPFLGTPDAGSFHFSGGESNTMNVLDQWIVSRGLHYGASGLRVKAGSAAIVRPPAMTTSGKQRAKPFDRATKKGYSDHFPIQLVLETV
jgi:endonuclease/exonuclease/phosphatase family protein